MSAQLSDTKIIRGQVTLMDVKWIALIALLVGELLALTIRFDSSALSMGGPLLALFSEHVSIVPQIVAVILTATLIFGGAELAESIAKTFGNSAQHRAWQFWLAAHVILFIAFGVATYYLFEVDHGRSVAALFVWFALAATCISAWMAALVPPADWMELGQKLFGPVAIGSIVGVIGWSAGQWSIQYWEPLAYWTFQLVSSLLYVSGIGVAHDLEQLVIGSAHFSVRIAPECSGHEGMGLGTVFVSTYLWWRRKDHIFPRSLVLIPISIGLMFVANALRIAGLIWIGHWGWQDFALGGFHSQAGWLAFNLVSLGLVAYARVSPYFCRNVAATHSSVELQSLPLLTPFIALTLSIMVTAAIQTGFDWLYPVRFFAVCIAIACLAKQFRPETWTWTWDWVSPSIGFAVFLIWMMLEPRGQLENRAMFDEARAQAPLLLYVWFVFRILGSVVTVPIAEEFAFRGYLLPWLSSSRVSAKSVRCSCTALLLSSVAFGALHPGRWIAGTIAGCLYGLAFYRRRLLMDAVMAHGTTNGLIACAVIYRSQWDLWS